MRVLAIDPGYERLGIAVVEKDRTKETLVHSECFRTSAKLPFTERLLYIGDALRRVIKEHTPDEFAIETLFFNSNQKTAMQVAEARGVVIYEAVRAGLAIHEYTPLEIKNATTGYGRATKDQVIAMVKQIISIQKKIEFDDEYDAIAVGLTHSASTKLPLNKTP